MTLPTGHTAPLNLGILAHVDAGKTSLTERLLFAAGVTASLGRVDDGNTQTDTLALERQRGITIRSAVVSFRIGPRVVNLIDTPGHPDFIAEVERVLQVLDGVVLVVSAVEGVQAQTRVLLRTLRRMGLPTLIFVNKVDRAGARDREVLAELAAKLAIDVVPMGSVRRCGTRQAEVVAPSSAAHRSHLLDVLTEHDDALVARYLSDSTVSDEELRTALIDQTRTGLVHPVFFGSAVTGTGLELLTDGIVTLLPAARGHRDRPLSGTVFKIERGKIERGEAGDKITYIRLFDGVLRIRDRVTFGQDPPGRTDKITALELFDGGPAVPADHVGAGQIARARGLVSAQIGAVLGASRSGATRADHAFAPPTQAAVVRPRRGAEGGALYTALTQLAEQDPLISFRREADRGELSVALYGEVQREVLEATLAETYGIEVEFSDLTTICIERVVGSGAAVELIADEDNPFFATVGLRVDPGAVGSGAGFGLETALHGTLPLAFVKAVEETVFEALQQGPCGWQVTDCRVTMTHSGYYPRQSHAHATFDKSMSSVAGDFRGLTPLVLSAALREAGTQVCEPVTAFTVEVPTETLRTLLPVLTRLGAVPGSPVQAGATTYLSGEIAAARLSELSSALPGATHGEGVLESRFAHYRPVRGPAPHRRRTGPDPANRKVYLQSVTR